MPAAKLYDEVTRQIQEGSSLRAAGQDPLYYAIFPPEQTLAMRRELKNWLIRLRKEGWAPRILSLSEKINAFTAKHDLRSFWVEAEQDQGAFSPETIRSVNETIGTALSESDFLENLLRDEASATAKETKGILVVTDCESLHPYLRIGQLEGALIGHIQCPVVVLYPGQRSGGYSLKFLGFYQSDGNYRSIHISQEAKA